MLGQGATGRPAGTGRATHAPCRRCSDLGRGLRLSRSLLELAELQLQLGDDLRAALGGLAVLLAPGLGEQQLEALDLQPGAGYLGLGVEPCRALCQDHRVRNGEVTGQGVEVIHTEESSRAS
jgi:hypothetical protein